MLRPMRPNPLIPTLIAICLLKGNSQYTLHENGSYIPAGPATGIASPFTLLFTAVATLLADAYGSARPAEVAAAAEYDLGACRLRRRDQGRRKTAGEDSRRISRPPARGIHDHTHRAAAGA